MTVITDPREQARAMKAADPSRSNGSIGEELGVTRSTIWKWLNPEKAKEAARRDNARRHGAKLEWSASPAGRALRREINSRHRAPCVDCGRVRGPRSKWEGQRCRSCEDAARRCGHEAILDDIEHMWNVEGMTGPQIARALGRNHPGGADPDIQELRDAGRLVKRR